MVNKSKIKGTSAETAITLPLRGRKWKHVERRALTGKNDRGDIAGIPGVVIEVKNCKTMDLSGWIDEAEKEKANDNAEVGVVWHKRPRKGDPVDWYVSMTGEQFMFLLEKAGY